MLDQESYRKKVVKSRQFFWGLQFKDQEKRKQEFQPT